MATIRYNLRTAPGAKRPGARAAMLGDRQTVSIAEACAQVGVSRRTIYNWMAEGKVEYVRTAGGSVRIFTETLWRRPDVPARRAPRAVASPSAP